MKKQGIGGLMILNICNIIVFSSVDFDRSLIWHLCSIFFIASPGCYIRISGTAIFPPPPLTRLSDTPYIRSEYSFRPVFCEDIFLFSGEDGKNRLYTHGNFCVTESSESLREKDRLSQGCVSFVFRSMILPVAGSGVRRSFVAAVRSFWRLFRVRTHFVLISGPPIRRFSGQFSIF